MTFSQKSVAAFLFAALPLAYACKKAETLFPIPVDHVVLQPGKSVVTTVGLTVLVDTINISICPKNSACFVADNLFASIRLVRNQESRSVRLFSGFGDKFGGMASSRGDSTSVRFGDQSYKVILKGQYTGEGEYGRSGRALLQVASL